MEIYINRQKVLRYISGDLHGMIAPEEALTRKASSRVLENTLSRHCKPRSHNLPLSENISKYLKRPHLN